MKKENTEKEEFIRVGTTLYKLVNQPRPRPCGLPSRGGQVPEPL